MIRPLPLDADSARTRPLFHSGLLVGLVAGLLTASGLAGADPLPAPETTPVVETPTGPPLAYASNDALAPRERKGGKMGPAPYGYWRTVGSPAPEIVPRGAGPSITFEPLGPQPIQGEFWSGDDEASGRVVSIAPHPTDPDTLYIASASGGAWKTTNGGASFTPISDELTSLNHGCVAVAPSAPETVYLSTGEYTTGSTGDGLFRSTDGGASWSRVATVGDTGGDCSGLIVDPTDADIVHWTGSGGYAHTTDGGATWTRTLNVRVSSLAIDPDDRQRLWAGGASTGIQRSTDGGATWTPQTAGLPTTGFSRLLVAVAPDDGDVLFAAFIGGGSLRGLYRSEDGGGTWTLKANTPDFPSPQGNYDAFVAVDPADPDVVWAGGVFPSYAVAGVIRSNDAGDSWTDVTVGVLGGQLHPDQHTIAFDASGRAWVGNDGGVWSSDDGGMTWLNHNATLAVTQIYALSLNPQDKNQMIGGTQDNGTVARLLGNDEWPQILSGDGGFSAFDAVEPERRYVTYIRLSIYRLGPGDGQFAEISGPWNGDSREFIAPMIIDPADSETLYGGSDRIWRTRNASTAANWTPLSPDFGSTVTAIAAHPIDGDTVWAGTRNGQVRYSTDSATWADVSTGLPTATVTDVVVDPADSTRAYASFNSSTGGRVYRTADGGATWTAVGAALPAGVRPNAITVDWRAGGTDHLYVGSGAGVWWSVDDGASWSKDGDDLPNVNVGDLLFDAESARLYVATYGRGMWAATVSDLFADDFEAGSLGAWSAAVGAP